MDPGAQAAQIKFNLTKWWKRSWMLRKTYLKPVPTTAVGASISNCPTTFYQADYEHHQKNEEANLRNGGSAGGDASKTKYRRNQGQDQKNPCVLQHSLSFPALACDRPTTQ